MTVDEIKETFSRIEKIGEILKDYGVRLSQPNIFESISPTFFRENFHSDIIAYYLRLELPKRKFIEFLNRVGRAESPISYGEYKKGNVDRESGRIDITLFTENRKKAIIIENKSNDAPDMDKQILRYVKNLSEQNIEVERIVYLRKHYLGQPDMSTWSKEDIERVKEKLIPMQFCGQNGFCDNIIQPTIEEANEARLKGISMEIGALFESLLSGGINMELASEFVTELRKKENLKSVQNVIKAYGDLPQYWVSQFENYLKQRLEEKKIEHWHVGRWYSACVYVDGIIIDNINFGFDLYFTSETVHIVPIARGAEQQRNKEHLRQKMGERWPFLAGVVNAGNQYTIIEETGEKAAYEAIDAIITAMRAAGASD